MELWVSLLSVSRLHWLRNLLDRWDLRKKSFFHTYTASYLLPPKPPLLTPSGGAGGARLAEAQGAKPPWSCRGGGRGKERRRVEWRKISQLHSPWHKSHRDLTAEHCPGPLIKPNREGETERVMQKAEEEREEKLFQVIITPANSPSPAISGH